METTFRHLEPLSYLRFGLKEAMWTRAWVVCEALAKKKYSPIPGIMEKRLYRLAEAAAYLGIPKGSLYKLAWQGRLPFVVRFGRFLFFDKQGMDKWIAENTQQVRL